MSQKIREIIYSIVQKASMLGSTYEDLAMTKENYKKSFDVILDQAHQSIISAILEKIPKEKEFNEGMPFVSPLIIDGFNQAITEIRERIKEI